MKLMALALGVLVSMNAFAGGAPKIADAAALKAVESNAVVKSVYSVYYSKHKTGGCDGCAVVGKGPIAKEEIPSIKVTECSTDLNGRGEIYCTATVSKEIFTNDDYIQELTIEASLYQDSKQNVSVVELKNIKFQTELND